MDILTRSDWEKQEEKFLASYAVGSGASRGRVHPEEEHPYRSVFQRDRDRIIHSTAFRRLEYKTQVFIYHEGDYYRTRLTHTIEVAQISGCIARALGLNEDLCEAIALAHDLGHTPFGHAGEKALNELMKDEGGFEHNKHGLRVVDELEKRYPDFAGLNLSWEVREGIIKHKTSYDKPSPSEFEPERMPSLEAQVVNAADEIAYNSHDLDDGLTAGLLCESGLEKVKLWREIRDTLSRKNAVLDREHRKYQIIRALIDFQVTDVLESTAGELDRAKISSAEDARNKRGFIVSFSPSMQKKNEGLKKFLLENMYLHYRVVRMTEKADRFIRELFNAYLSCPGQLPAGTQARLKTESPQRVICDYVAGMTDHFALDEYKKLFEPYEKV
jgi:dGTPase